MRRTATIVPKRTIGGDDTLPSVERNTRQRIINHGMMSHSSIAFVLAMVALSTTPIHPVIPRFLSRLTNPQPHNPYNRPIGAQTTFLLGIFSSVNPKDASRREVIRESYLDIGDPRICTLEEFMRQVEETPYERVCQVPYTFVIGSGGDHRPTDHDDDEPLTVDTDHNGFSDVQGDCTYLNIRENVDDGKSSAWFKYASSIADEYVIDYIAKVDDMSILSPELFFQFQEDLPVAPFNQQMYGGLPKPSYHHKLFYGTGEFYFMSADVANYVGHTLTADERQQIMSKETSRMEDADMGALVLSSPRPIKFMNLHGYQIWSWSHPSKPWDFIGSLGHDSGNQKSVARNDGSWWSNCPTFITESFA